MEREERERLTAYPYTESPYTESTVLVLQSLTARGREG